LIGAIIGDIIGSPYEFDKGNKSKLFPLLNSESHYTDDTIMTIAVAMALMGTYGQDDYTIKKALVKCMRQWGEKYPDAGYGANFMLWLKSDECKPYNSFGNGSAMRVSSVGWLYDDIDSVTHIARLTAEVTHNHPEGIKGAEAVANAIFLARKGHRKTEIKKYIEKIFGYNLSMTCDEIRPTYHHVESCQETVPQAIIAFLESENFEDAIRNAVSLGGDCDTLTCITGSIAEAYYGIPDWLIQECKNRLSKDILSVLKNFTNFLEFLNEQKESEIAKAK
jgi:ADP-ribosylglycohydrolase